MTISVREFEKKFRNEIEQRQEDIIKAWSELGPITDHEAAWDAAYTEAVDALMTEKGF